MQIDEAERDRQLQQTVAYLGVGAGAGGLFAASYSQKKAVIQLPVVGEIPVLSKADPMIKCFTYSIVVGVLVAFAVGEVLRFKNKAR